MFKDVLVRKPIDQLMKEASNTRELKRVLGPLNLTTFGIGAIIALVISKKVMGTYSPGSGL